VVGLGGLGVRTFAGEDFTVVTLEQFAQGVAGALWGGEMVLLVEGFPIGIAKIWNMCDIFAYRTSRIM
jgi:hypothetical protein